MSELRDALLIVCGVKGYSFSSQKLGWYLKYFEGRIAGGYVLEQKPKIGNGKHAHQYRVAAAAKLGGAA